MEFLRTADMSVYSLRKNDIGDNHQRESEALLTRKDFRPENDRPGGRASESGLEITAHLQAIRRISLRP